MEVCAGALTSPFNTNRIEHDEDSGESDTADLTGRTSDTADLTERTKRTAACAGVWCGALVRAGIAVGRERCESVRKNL